VHTDSASRQEARDTQAAAFTVGRDIAVADMHALEGPAGDWLLAHELAHTIQQEGSAPAGQVAGAVSGDAAEELDASRAATSAGAGGAARVRHRVGRQVVQRQLETPFRGRVRSPVLEELVTQETELVAGIQGRPLTPLEIELARTIFADSIDYARVRLLRAPEPLWFRTVGNVIRIPPYFTVDPSAPQGLRQLTVDYMRHTFIHELTHVWQYQHGGTSYISYSIGPQILAMASGKGRNAAYCYEADARKSFWSFTPEQQGLIVENTFLMRTAEKAVPCGPQGQLHWEFDPAVIDPLKPIHELYVAQMRSALPAPEAEIKLQRASEVMTTPGAELSGTPRERQLTPVKPLLEWRF
jgi:type VI secretion system secreted protein VgrG